MLLSALPCPLLFYKQRMRKKLRPQQNPIDPATESPSRASNQDDALQSFRPSHRKARRNLSMRRIKDLSGIERLNCKNFAKGFAKIPWRLRGKRPKKSLQKFFPPRIKGGRQKSSLKNPFSFYLEPAWRRYLQNRLAVSAITR